jgi:hypothetical protein
VYQGPKSASFSSESGFSSRGAAETENRREDKLKKYIYLVIYHFSRYVSWEMNTKRVLTYLVVNFFYIHHGREVPYSLRA